MKKSWIVLIIIAIIIGIILGVGFAIYSVNQNKTDGTVITSEKQLANDNTIENSNNQIDNSNIIETSSTNTNISPNAILITKIYYKSCDHLIRKSEDISEELINKSREDVEKAYPEWKIEEFSPTQITLYKTENGNCGEHYWVQEHNGVIGIYVMDEYGVKTLKEDTEISTQYLPEEDIKNLQAGIEIIGHTKLVEFLEDYE